MKLLIQTGIILLSQSLESFSTLLNAKNIQEVMKQNKTFITLDVFYHISILENCKKNKVFNKRKTFIYKELTVRIMLPHPRLHDLSHIYKFVKKLKHHQ